MQDREIFIKTAMRCLELDLNPVPCNKLKAPQGLKQQDGSYKWDMFQDRQITLQEFEECMNGNTHGLGIVCGKVCRMLEVIDIDHKYDISGALVNDYFKLINDHNNELFNSLFIVRTPTNGYHLYYRCEVIEGNQKLARRYTTEDELAVNAKEKVKVLIETRGEGGYIVCPPTPGYEPWQKNEIPTITPEQRNFLLDAARSFNEVHEVVRKVPREQNGMVSPWELSPWDDFDQRGDIISILESNGWKEDHKTADRIYLTRPGKDKGTSADYHKGKRLFKCWSTSQGDFEEQKAYSHTAVYALLECSGDFSKACDQLHANGYGKRKPAPVKTEEKGQPEGERKIAQPEIDLEALFRSRILDQTKDYPAPEPLISLKYRDDIYPLLTKKSFSLFQGKQKSKKTVTLALMIAAYIRYTIGQEDIDFIGHGDGKVLWFDCEQGESYAARTMKLILKLTGMDISDRLLYGDFREDPPAIRMQLIEAGIRCTPGAQLVIIDGTVDLMNDFMEAAEGHGVITRLLALCSQYNVHIAGVLHQNKADKNARAHVGSIASQKCEIEITTEVDPDDKARSIVSCVNARGLPFESFAIRWDKGALPCIDTEYQTGTSKLDVKSQKDYERSKEICNQVFKNALTRLTHTQAQQAIMRINNKGESTATRIIKNMKLWGWIEQGEDKLYRLVI